MKILIFLFYIQLCYSLLPKKMPDGKSRKFIANKNNPYQDLKLITPQKAKLTCKLEIINPMFLSTEKE